MKTISFYLKWSLFFLAAIVFALTVHWLRQRPPDSSNAGWPYQVVETLDQTGDLFHALEELPRALNDPQSHAAALQFQAALEQRKAQSAAALRGLNDEIDGTERKYKIPKLTFLKGTIADLWQDDQQALRWYQKAIEMKPKMSIAYVRQGLVYERMGQIELAQQSFQNALKLSKEAPLSHFHYGLFLARSTKRKSEALAEADYLEKVRPLYARIIREKAEQDSAYPVSTSAL